MLWLHIAVEQRLLRAGLVLAHGGVGRLGFGPLFRLFFGIVLDFGRVQAVLGIAIIRMFILLRRRSVLHRRRLLKQAHLLILDKGVLLRQNWHIRLTVLKVFVHI